LAKILIVEDNALNIKLFCDLLAAHGHEPEAVTDSRNALDAARSFVPDLVITDIQLPHVSGLELIRMIRGDEKLASVPIMAVTAYAAKGDEERIRQAGAEAYISKPVTVLRFMEAVRSLTD
jgi:two-component system cell cycle response regulator DivK